jgi:hypothetical protein
MSYSISSKDFSLDGTILIANCRREDGKYTYHKSAIDLDGKIGNDNGEFKYGSKHFSYSADNIKVSSDGKKLSAKLHYLGKNGENLTKDASYDLDKAVTNSDGLLEWT